MAASGLWGTARARRVMTTTAIVLLMAGCENGFDFDLRDLGDGFDTSDAVTTLPERPVADDRGVISYPNYQVALARQGDTVQSVADRLGIDGGELARFNGLAVDAPLRTDEVVALPGRVAADTSGTSANGTLDVAAVATTALDRVGDAGAPAAVPASPAQAVNEPVRYRVGRGDTAFSIARDFNVPVSTIAAWNTLDANLTVREGQFILIPQTGNTPVPAPSVLDTPLTEPGVGTITPVPPSAGTPLPEDDTATETAPEVPEAPDLGEAPASTTETAPPVADTAQLLRPVDGTIIRAFAPGRNEGIDIGAPAGTPVKAADAGTVAAVTTDTSGFAIVVLRHADNLLTVYTQLADPKVAKDDTVNRGDVIAEVGPRDPSFLHFEVRRGLDALDPADYLP